MDTRPVLMPPFQRMIALPNKNTGKKINLGCLHDLLVPNAKYKPSYDTDSNPRQNYLEIKSEYKIYIYSNGTMKTDLNLPDEVLLEFAQKFYSAYVKQCLEESK